MQASLLLLAVTGAAVQASGLLDARATAQCNPGNNCQRGVGGTAGNKPPLSSRMADCSSFMLTTVTPAPATATVTVTTTLPIEAKRGLAPRQVTVTPSVVPTYATYCPDASAYSSACSCAGVTAMTTTAPTPTVTVTATATFCADTMCGSVCADLTQDPLNCGACGNACAGGTICFNSACIPTCNDPAVCDGSATCDSDCGFCLQDVTGDGPAVCLSEGQCDGCTDSSQCTDAPGGVCVTGCCGTGCVYPDQFCYSTSTRKRAGGLEYRAVFGGLLPPDGGN